MRILHTADWHAGRTLRGADRTPEIAGALRELAGVARSERVDLVLVGGDLFDGPNPPADAEAAVYDFFLELGAAGIPSVAIAGNHDSAQRLESVAGLLKRVKVAALGRVASDASAVEVPTASGQTAVVAALPFLSERRLVKAATLLDGDVGAWRQKYREGMAFFVERLARSFRADTVNLMMLHTTVDGGKLSNSEFQFYVTNSYSISAESLPSSAQYVALGHLHRPQRLRDAPPVEYAGSVVQLDFGEAGEQKSARLVEVSPGAPARVHPVLISSGKPLRNVRVDVDGLERRLEELRAFPGYLKVCVKLDTPLPGLKDRVIAMLPQALAVEVDLGEPDVPAPAAAQNLTPLESFERYYLERRGQDVPDEIRRAFLELQVDLTETDDATVGLADPAEAPA